MRIVNEFMPSIGTASTPLPAATPSYAGADTKGLRIVRRLRALMRLIVRRRRAVRHLAELQHLDDATLRDIGLTRSEAASVVSEIGGRVAATRRRTELDFLLSASTRFHVRSADTSF